MIFPLKNRQLIRGCAAHIKAGLGCAADYTASVGTPLYAPSDGKITREYWGADGGNWLWYESDGYSLQFAHLSEYKHNLGDCKQGELIALTGNTGSITTGPHLHIQIIKNDKRYDVEQWFDERLTGETMYTEEQVKMFIYRTVWGHEPQGDERAFALGPITVDELISLRFGDDSIGGLWTASTGDLVCPTSEKDFYKRYFAEHTDQKPSEFLALQWHTDHAADDGKLNQAKQIATLSAASINAL